MDMVQEMFDEELYYSLETSSYVKKVLKEILPVLNRLELEKLYKKAREYACNSIVDRLKSSEGMVAGKIYHLDCSKDHFLFWPEYGRIIRWTQSRRR